VARRERVRILIKKQQNQGYDMNKFNINATWKLGNKINDINNTQETDSSNFKTFP
jgi:uncharacterized protein (UPF0303 family)